MIRGDKRRLLPLALLLTLTASCSREAHRSPTDPPDPPPPPPPSSATITLQPAVSFQTIVGWEGTQEIGPVHDESLLNEYQDELFQLAVNELGLNRMRLSVRSGAQNSIDWFARWKQRQISDEEWRARRYEISPQRTYNFTELDFWVEHSVEPMRRELAARGEALYINLCYVNFEKQVPNPVYHHWDDPAAYGAFMVAAFRQLEGRYGWVPDAVEVILEPDNVEGWTGGRIGAALVAAGDSLRAAGYTPDFIAPSTTNMSTAIGYFDELIAVPRVTQYLKAISYHRYRGVSLASLEGIAGRARQHNLQTGMLEHIGSGHQDLHEDLKVGLNSAWQQFVIAFPDARDNGGKYFIIDASVLGSPRIVPGHRNRYLKLYFRYVRRDAVRIGATSTDGRLDPLAFRNADGRHVVVVKAESGASFSIGGLPPGPYGIRYSTEGENDRDAGEVAVTADQLLSTSIPQAGVLTAFRK